MKFKSIENCVTTNCYWGMEINAHALINFIILCRDKNYAFDITLLQSQACESFFRTCRSFTSTESTVVNFDMHSFESRLNRIEAKIEITQKRKDDFKFPRLKETDDNFRLQLPSNINIVGIVEEAKHQATCLLNTFGINVTEELFRECIFVRKPKEKRDDHMGNFEFVPVYENIEEVNIADVCDVDELFTNAGSELQVKDSCSSNDRNTFKIRNKNGKVVRVKKSTFIWMLQSDISRVSTDRLHRFHEASKVDEKRMIFLNETRQNISIGEWILIDVGDGNLLICKVYEFVYLSGKRKTYTRFTAPVTVPKGVEAKGIGLKGTFFDLMRIDNEYSLDLNENSDKFCLPIENYKTHLKKPSHISGIITYCKTSAKYIDTFLK